MNQKLSSVGQERPEVSSLQTPMLEAQLNAIELLATEIALDIRNIITPFPLALAMGDTEQIVEAAQIQRDRLLLLTHRLLALRRSLPLRLQPIHVSDLLNTSLQLIQAQAEVGRVSLRTHIARKLPCVYGDRDRLEHLFTLLLLNALNGMWEQSGCLTVLVEEEEGRIRMDVKDTGRGIPPEQLSRLFDPFFSTRANSTGLELFSIQQIVEEHQGAIRVQSQLGKGTCLSVWLPIAESTVLEEEERDGCKTASGR